MEVEAMEAAAMDMAAVVVAMEEEEAAALSR